MNRSFSIVGLLGALTCLAPFAQAQGISYDYHTTLSLSSGTDTMQLDNATCDITFTVAEGSVYGNRFGYPEIPVMNPQITINGSGLAVNNGTFSLEASAFYPTFAGLFSEPGGIADHLVLPGGKTLQLQINTVPTAAGRKVNTGDVVDAAQFGPTTSAGYTLPTTDGSASYNQNGTTVRAVQTSAVPEPGNVALLVSGMAGAGFAFRRKTRK